jgi:excinuclease ABC subunit C
MQKLFRLRTCEDPVFNNRTRPCLLYQIKRCSAPCVGHISAGRLCAGRRQCRKISCGRCREVLALEARMMAHADKLEFEQAAELRDQVAALSNVLHQQSVDNVSDRDVDILAVKVQGGKACVNLAMVRGGRHLGDRPYFPAHVEDASALQDDSGVTRRQPEPCRGGPGAGGVHGAALCGQPVPASLVTSEPVRKRWCEALSEQTGVKVSAVHQPREQRRIWLEMAQTNASLQLARLLAEEGSQQARTRALAEALDLAMDDLDALRVECFDISHTAGEATQASCVVFHHHKMQNAEYRRYTSRASRRATTTRPCARC